jgi:COP9 signalosome complex subunit 5
MTDQQAALQRWELENEISGPESEDIINLYRWDDAAARAIQNEKPWKSDPNYFKKQVIFPF